MNVQNSTEIIICPTCKGKEYIQFTENRGPLTKFTTEKCKRCNGTGKLLKKTQITFEPFKAENYD